MKYTILFIVGIACIVVIGGCSTIVNGTTQSVSISSDPSGAEVQVDGNPVGVTPLSTELKRKHNHLVTISLDGYKTQQITINKVMSGAVAGNILAGGLIGWGIDAANGSQYKLKPDTIAVVLVPGSTDERDLISSVDQLDIRTRLEQLEQLKSDGLITEEEYEATRKVIIDKLDD